MTLAGSRPSTGPPLSDEVLERARDACNRAGRGLEMARVDLLLSAQGEIYLGEMTPYPGGGKHAWQGDLDEQLGRAWCESRRT